MAYLDDAGSVLNPAVAGRVQSSFKAQAVAIYNEGSGVTNHTVRAAFATKVLNGTISWNDLIWAACAQGITSASTDANIDTAVASIWNALAGA